MEFLERRSQTLQNRAGGQKGLRAFSEGAGRFCAPRVEAFAHFFAGLKDGDGLFGYWQRGAGSRMSACARLPLFDGEYAETA
jgi:hypothetical protein